MKNVGVHHALIVALALTPLLCNGQTAASNSTPSERSHPTTITEPFTPTQTNVAVIERVTELEQEVAHLRQELRATQTNGIGAFSLRTAVYSPSDATPASAGPAAAPAAKPAAPQAPDPLSGFSSVLGGATVVGLVDGYYSYNFNHPSAASSALSGTPGNFSSLRLFDARNNQFALNLVELGLVKAPDADQRLGYKAIFGFGDAMQQVNVISGGDPGFLQYLKEAYLSYLAPAGKGLQIDVGKFVTPNGAEVIESNGNWNYSRSLLFNYAIPFYHYGIRAQYTFSPKFALTGYVVNGWNDVIHDTSTAYHNSGKTGGLTFAWTATKKLTVTDNWMGGPGATQLDGNHWRNLFDTVIGYNWNSKLSFQLNGDYGRVEKTTLSPLAAVDWWGGAGYVKYQFNPRYAVAARYEYYNDPNGYTTGIVDVNGHGPHIQEVTTTLERRVATHLISRFEYRHDQSNQSFFPKGKPTNLFVSSQNTMAVGLIFVLEPIEGNK